MAQYRMIVLGKIDLKWGEWFSGMIIRNSLVQDQPITLMEGSLPDQAALHGVLAKIRDLDLPLVYLHQTDFTGFEYESKPENENEL